MHLPWCLHALYAASSIFLPFQLRLARKLTLKQGGQQARERCRPGGAIRRAGCAGAEERVRLAGACLSEADHNGGKPAEEPRGGGGGERLRRPGVFYPVTLEGTRFSSSLRRLCPRFKHLG